MKMASSISTQLRADETILYQTGLKPLPMVACSICLLFMTLFLVMFALNPSTFLQEFFQRSPNKTTGRDDLIFYFVVAAFFIFVLYLCVKFIYDYLRCEVVVTNQRIIGKIPTAFLIFSLQPLDIPLAELQYVSTTYYGGASYGYVIAGDRFGKRTIFRNFADPEELRRQIIQDRVLEAESPQQVRRRWSIQIFCFIVLIVTAIICYGYLLPLLDSTSKGKAPPPRTAPSAEKNVDQGIKEKDPKIKIELYTKAIELNPNDAVAYNSRGYTHLTQKNFGYALRDLNRAIALNPSYAEAYNNRGKVYYQRKEYIQALRDYGRAISLKPDFAEAYVNRGQVYFIREDYDLAIMDFDLAIAIKPNYAAAYYFRAAVYNQQGDVEQARANYTKAKSLDPKLPDLNIKVK
jgi:tetratricopeptide (TPR) repeat protein